MMRMNQPTASDMPMNEQRPGLKSFQNRIRKRYLISIILILIAVIGFDKSWWVMKDTAEIIKEANTIEVKVLAVVMDSLAAMPTVVLYQEKENIALPIWIGASEAIAIQAEISGERAPRPLTGDLLKSVMDLLNARLLKAEITRVVDKTFYAQLCIQGPDDKISILDARPSDAIGLAVRFKSPIFVNKKVLQQYGITAGKEEQQSTGKTRRI
jgi:bifunctional DNase/RNase